MITQSLQRPIFRGIRVAGTPTISADRASNAMGLFRAFEKRRASGAYGVRQRIDRSEPKGASSRDKETEGIWNTTSPRKRGRSRNVNDLGFMGLICLFGDLVSWIIQSLQLLKFDRPKACCFSLLFSTSGH